VKYDTARRWQLDERWTTEPTRRPRVSPAHCFAPCFNLYVESILKKSLWIPLVATITAASVSACDRSGQPPTAEEIVANCAEAMGGEQGIQALKTLRFQLGSANQPQRWLWEIARPNFVRKERAGDLVLVFDGNKAAFLQAPPNDDGSPSEPHVVPEEEWHDFEMDIALYVPAFFDYPATYVDTISVNGAAAHLLQVNLPLGGVAAYAVDAESFLPLKVALPAWDYEIYLDDYREVGGYLYFHEYWTAADPENVTVLENLEVNVELPADRFTIPASLR
jgi:hypothetical protein